MDIKNKMALDERVLKSWQECRTLSELGPDRPDFSEWIHHLAVYGRAQPHKPDKNNRQQ